MCNSYLVKILLVAAIVTFLCFYSCNKINKIVNSTEQKVTDKKDEMVDKFLPTFDSGTPDTKWNKKRFTEFLKVELTPDIYNIYCFDDAIGIDASYRFSFNCDTSTVKRILDKHQMVVDTIKPIGDGIIFNYVFDWWQKDKIDPLQLYTWKSADKRYIKHFWYNEDEQKAYYFTYDL